MDYSDRKIKAVSLSGVRLQEDRATAELSIGMEALEDPSQLGPAVNLTITIEASPDETIGDLQSRLLEAAVSLLNRLSNETSDSLSVSKRDWEASLSKPLGIDLPSSSDN